MRTKGHLTLIGNQENLVERPEVNVPMVHVKTTKDGIEIELVGQSVVLSPLEAELMASTLASLAARAHSMERHPSNQD